MALESIDRVDIPARVGEDVCQIDGLELKEFDFSDLYDAYVRRQEMIAAFEAIRADGQHSKNIPRDLLEEVNGLLNNYELTNEEVLEQIEAIESATDANFKKLILINIKEPMNLAALGGGAVAPLLFGVFIAMIMRSDNCNLEDAGNEFLSLLWNNAPKIVLVSAIVSFILMCATYVLWFKNSKQNRVDNVMEDVVRDFRDVMESEPISVADDLDSRLAEARRLQSFMSEALPTHIDQVMADNEAELRAAQAELAANNVRDLQIPADVDGGQVGLFQKGGTVDTAGVNYEIQEKLGRIQTIRSTLHRALSQTWKPLADRKVEALATQSKVSAARAALGRASQAAYRADAQAEYHDLSADQFEAEVEEAVEVEEE